MKRKTISSIAIILGIMLIISSIAMMAEPGVVFALELVGDELGLRIEPSDTALFNVRNMNPGDTMQASMTIRNVANGPFTAFVSMAKTDGTTGEGDLYHQLVMTIAHQGVEMYKGPMSGFSQYRLGEIEADKDQVLDFTVHLPGPETGNEYQGSTLAVKLVFTATQEGAPPPAPPTPPTSGFDTILLLAGVIIFVVGIIVRRRSQVKEI
ncbi:MAG: hypothetical protein NUK65_02275 [Firmicutes bacterium]|nr:hypothetical protein [Bacillota bacterium]